MTALMVGAARTTEEKIHVHGLHYVSTSTPQRSPTAGPAQQGSVRSELQHPGSIERRDALLNLEIIHRVIAQRRARPGRRGAEPAARRHRRPAVPVVREDAARKACPRPWDRAGMSKAQQHRQTKKARTTAAAAHDPLVVELVKLLARAAAERDYISTLPQGSAGKASTRRANKERPPS